MHNLNRMHNDHKVLFYMDYAETGFNYLSYNSTSLTFKSQLCSRSDEDYYSISSYAYHTLKARSIYPPPSFFNYLKDGGWGCWIDIKTFKHFFFFL